MTEPELEHAAVDFAEGMKKGSVRRDAGVHLWPAWALVEAFKAGAQLAAPAPAPSDLTDRLIDAAEHYAAVYDGDDRQDVKCDVMNGFYQGAHWAMKNAAPAPSERKPRVLTQEEVEECAACYGLDMGQSWEFGCGMLAEFAVAIRSIE